MTPSIDAYRTEHRIQVDDSGPLPVCAVDNIRIHPTKVGGWFHDAETIRRLHREDIRRMVTSERVSDSFGALIINCSDNHPEGCSCRLSGVVG